MKEAMLMKNKTLTSILKAFGFYNLLVIIKHALRIVCIICDFFTENRRKERFKKVDFTKYSLIKVTF